MLSVRRYSLSRAGLLSLLEELKANSSEVGSLCLPPGFPEADVAVMLMSLTDEEAVPEELTSLLAGSPTGGMVFWGAQHRYLVLPPFPLPRTGFSRTCEIGPLYDLLHREYLLGLVLVRLGEYAIGVFQGQKLLTGKRGTGLVHARHRQGGSSAHRFERHREKQMEAFFTRVCGHAREQLEPYAIKLDYLLYGGTRETVLDFRKQCRFLQAFDEVTLERLLNVREPRKSGLTAGIQEAWSSRVVRWE